MNYFLADFFAQELSGIEHAQMKRLKLFRSHGQKAQIVIRQYNRFLQRDIEANNLKPSDVLGLYDHFQKPERYTKKPVTLGILAPANSTGPIKQNDTYTFFINGHKSVEIKLFGVNGDIDGPVDSAYYYDYVGNQIRADYYDPRGFKSMSDFYGINGGVAQEINYDYQGKAVVTSYYQRGQNGNIGASRWEFVDDDGLTRSVWNMEDIFAYFLDQLVRHDSEKHTNFISDRAYATDSALYNMTEQAGRYVYWHNVYTDDYDNPKTGRVYDTLTDEMNNRSKLTALITPSQRERDDMDNRVNAGVAEKLPIFRAPAPTLSDEQLNRSHTPMNERSQHKIISVARIHEQKRLEDLISAFAQVKKQIPDATLDIHGYVNDNQLYARLQDQARQAGLADEVTFFPYTNDIDAVYEDAQVLGLSSRYEGLNMAMVEALSHGVPSVAYDCNYGSADVVEDGVNGYLIENGNVDALAAGLIKALSDQALLQKLSDGAYKSAVKFSEDNVWKLWQAAGIK